MVEHLKSKNIADLLFCLFKSGSATKAELVRETSLGNTTVSDIINDLSRLALVKEVGKQSSEGGRRSSIYGINKDYGNFVGISLHEDRFEFALSDCHNCIVETWTVIHDRSQPAITTIMNKLKSILLSYKNVLGVGVGLHGEIEYKSQVVISCEALRWKYVHLTEIIEREFQTFTYIDHSINAAALKERIFGNAKHYSDFIYYSSQIPDKLAIMLAGKVCRGKNNMAGLVNGSIKDKINTISSLIQTMDVEKVFVTGKEMKSQIKHGFSDVELVESKDYDLPHAMALAAEVMWFYRALWRKGVLVEQVF